MPADSLPTTVPAAAPTKPGWQTTEFWLSLIAAITPYLISAVPPQWAVVASTVLGGLYGIGRAAIKVKGEGKGLEVQ
jgi:hypothetical protein